MKDARRLDFGWEIPDGYRSRSIFQGRFGRLELEVVPGGVELAQWGVLDARESSMALDWEAMAITQIREELGV